MSRIVEILYVPEALRENVSETAAERIERRIVQTKTEIIREIAAAESRLFWKTLAFLAGQTGVLILVMRLLLGK
ncbi:MAG TPA: hypothetical protein GXX25_07040 [Desulfotomaculum sp.]|nr:hypothetical protein [Desulfotomaculum sp.]